MTKGSVKLVLQENTCTIKSAVTKANSGMNVRKTALVSQETSPTAKKWTMKKNVSNAPRQPTTSLTEIVAWRPSSGVTTLGVQTSTQLGLPTV